MTLVRNATSIGGLILTLVVGSLPFPVWDREMDGTINMIGNEAIYWVLVAATLLYVRRVEGRTFESIGFRRPGWRDAAAAIACAIATVACLATIYFLVFPALGVDESGQIGKLVAAPPWWLAISVLRAGVSEEILFRGYPIERIREWTGSRMLAVLVPLLVFALAHVGPWGWPHAFVALVGGALFTALYLWRRNLWANMLAHVLVDAIAVLG